MAKADFFVCVLLWINPKQINFPQAPHPGSQLPWKSTVVTCSEMKVMTSRQGQINEPEFKATSYSLRCSVVTLDCVFFTDGNTFTDYFSGCETAQKQPKSDSHTPLLFLVISLVPIPLLHRPSYKNKIAISTAEASPFYWRLPDARVIMSYLGFDRPTRERLVLQGESMALGHIPINGLPQLFLLMLSALWQIRRFIKKKRWGKWRMGDVNSSTHRTDSIKTFDV